MVLLHLKTFKDIPEGLQQRRKEVSGDENLGVWESSQRIRMNFGSSWERLTRKAMNRGTGCPRRRKQMNIRSGKWQCFPKAKLSLSLQIISELLLGTFQSLHLKFSAYFFPEISVLRERILPIGLMEACWLYSCLSMLWRISKVIME